MTRPTMANRTALRLALAGPAHRGVQFGLCEAIEGLQRGPVYLDVLAHHVGVDARVAKPQCQRIRQRQRTKRLLEHSAYLDHGTFLDHGTSMPRPGRTETSKDILESAAFSYCPPKRIPARASRLPAPVFAMAR